MGIRRRGLWEIGNRLLYSEILPSGELAVTKIQESLKGFDYMLWGIPKSCFNHRFRYLFAYVKQTQCFYIQYYRSNIIFGCSYFQKVEQLCNKGIKKVSCGTQFSVALACDGHVYTFGQGTIYCESGL